MGVDCCLIALSWELVVGCLFPFPKFRLNSSVELTNNDHPNVRRNRPITPAFFYFISHNLTVLAKVKEITSSESRNVQ
jgi:hypothetical protein